jgi:hypothetical protein
MFFWIRYLDQIIEERQMNKIKRVTELLTWFMALLLVAFEAGCGGGSGDPILGVGGGVQVDTTRPRVALTIPAASGVGSTTAAIIATFTKAMAPATLNSPATSFTLVDKTAASAVAATSVSYDSGSRTAIFKHAPLIATHVYTATIKGIGIGPATDPAGHALAGNQAALPAASNYVWSFNIGAATPAPTIILTSPVSGVSNVPINTTVNATFDQNMDPTTIIAANFTLVNASAVATAGSVGYDTASKIATFTPSINLALNTTYTATVSAGATDLAGLALVAGTPNLNPWSFTTGASAVLAPGAVPLGTVSTFGIMATAAVTAASASTINGDVSLEPGTSITGFPPAVVNGAVHINDSVSHQARNDLLAAYNNAKTLPPGTGPNALSAGADPGALFPGGVPPGTYTSGSTIIVSTPMVLDAGGNANAVWVFQIGSSLTSNADVTLANGAQAKNVFWVPTSDATIGVGTTFNGTIVAGRDATSSGGATINGRILAGAITAGTIALNGTPSTINVPAP